MNYQIQQLVYDKNKIVKKEPVKLDPTQKNIAIIIHVFYIDVWKEIAGYLEQLDIAYDLYVTVPEGTADSDIAEMIKNYPDMHIYMTENRGRDVLPFLQVMNIIGTERYAYICKLHTKKTNDSALGNVWRKLLYFDLLGSTSIVNAILDLFNQHTDIGIVTGKNTILDSERYDYGNTTKIDKLMEMSGLTFDDEYFFAGGTMFWIRPVLLQPVIELFQSNLLDFEEERGQKDHTLAHAIERYFGIVCQLNHQKIVESPSQYSKLDDETLNEVAGLVLSQQYVGEDVFIKQKRQIHEYREAMKFKEEEAAKLEEIAQSLRLKNRLKNLIPEKIISVPQGMFKIFQTMKNNPAGLKKALYYIKRGELRYLLTKVKEKSRKNIGDTDKLTAIEPQKIFKKFNKKEYSLEGITVDIIIPVYNGYEFLEALFNSIEKNTTSPYRLIVVNDCSPDERVQPYLLKRLAKHTDALFIDHEENLGFVKSVNEAYSHTSNHFLILNTDTEVPEFWMERLMYPIVHMDNVASTTPFTNSGQIASFPNFIADNDIFEGMTVSALDRVFRNVNPKDFYTEIPTGVGFCMGINYDLIQEIGFFSEEEFGKGYGEENDWCQRAILHGYKNLMVPNLFVYHKHGGSFSAEQKALLMKENAVKLLHKHPNYDKDVEAYVQNDPHHTLRQIMVLVAASSHGEGVYLIIDQALGGGANSYRRDLAETYQKEGKKVLQLIFDLYANRYKIYFDYGEYHFSFSMTELHDLELFFAQIVMKEIFLNNLVSFQESHQFLAFVEKMTLDNQAELIIPIHDYYAVCPNYTLLNPDGEFCEIPSLETCKSCMASNNLEWKTFFNDSTDVKLWRGEWRSLFSLAHTVLCFSHSSKELLLRAYKEIEDNKIKIIPHEVPALPAVQKLLSNTEKTSVTIGVLGAINQAKGARVLKELVKEIEKRDLDIQIVLIGEISEHIKSKHFDLTGRYKRELLPELVQQHEIDIFLIPSVCPETFSYTTQEIMMMGMPVMVFDVGAPAERVATYDQGAVLKKPYVENILKHVLEQR